MAHVLIMAALQLCHPVTFFIQMKSSDLSLHYPRSYREWHRTISDGLTVNPCGCHRAATADGSGRMSGMYGIGRAHAV
jgi:hypothetical protein